MGDFNSDPAVSDSSTGYILHSFMGQFYLHELVQCPTRVTATYVFGSYSYKQSRLLLLFFVAVVIITMFSLIFVPVMSLSVLIIKLFSFVNIINFMLNCVIIFYLMIHGLLFLLLMMLTFVLKHLLLF